MKRASRFLLTCVGAVFLLSGFLAAQDTVAGLAGTWSGQATKQGSTPYKVTVILDANGAGFIEYSELRCGGTLRFLQKNGNAFSFAETITHGKEGCGADGRIDLVPNGDAVAWTWRVGPMRATATLTKLPAILPARCALCDFYHERDFQACSRSTTPAAQQRCEDQANEDLRSCRLVCNITR